MIFIFFFLYSFKELNLLALSLTIGFNLITVGRFDSTQTVRDVDKQYSFYQVW
jgi:hypothetical protein